MKYDYQYKITFELNEPFDINYIKNVCNQYPNSKILVEAQNTKGISSSMIKQLSSNVAIRIAGGYDAERISRYGKDLHWSSNYYNEAVIYTKNETIKMLEEIERIESGLNKNWSDIQKLLYVYDRLKTGIMYDPKYEHKLSSEIRSLRGLITKQTVCAGYAMILKEFMDRNGINCEYVEGHTKIDSNGQRTGGHAWNIINIDGKKYPIDLTWDNATFRAGKSNSFDWLGKDISTFSRSHHPAPGEKTQDYEHTLSQIDPQFVKQIHSQMGVGRARDYRSTTYYGTRKDGSKFIIAQVGDETINNEKYYRYYYVEISKEGKKQLPLILYGDDNLADFMNYKNFGMPKKEKFSNEDDYNQKLKLFNDRIKKIDGIFDNVLFSKENINDSMAKKTYYIGSIRKNTGSNKKEYITEVSEIDKTEEKRNLFVYPTRIFTRSDGSVFIAQQMFKTPHKANGIDVMRYDIFEMVNENGKDVLKRNSVVTEKNIFKDTRQSIVDDYLSRERLDRDVFKAGGYIGYYDANGIITYNPDLVKFFETSKKVDINSLNSQKQQVQTPAIKIPQFTELKDLASKYELDVDEQQNIITLDRATGEVITDPKICTIANFANIWLTSAGVKTVDGRYEDYAFNDEAKYTYDFIKLQCKKQLEKDGKISPLDVLKSVDQLNYKHAEEIVSRLFGFYSQPQIVNDFFKLDTPNAKPYEGQIEEFILDGKMAKISDYVGEIETIDINETPVNNVNSNRKTSAIVDDWENDEHMRAAMEFNAIGKKNSIDNDWENDEHMRAARQFVDTREEIESAIERAERKYKLSNMSKEELNRYFESEFEKDNTPERLMELRLEMLANRIIDDDIKKDSDDTTKGADLSYGGQNLAKTPGVPNKQKGNNIQQSQNSSGNQNGQSQSYTYSNNQSGRKFDDSSSKKQEDQRPKTQPSNDNDRRNAEYNKQAEERRRQFLMNELMRSGMDELQRYLQHEQDVQKRNEFSLMLSELEERKNQQAIDEQKQNSGQKHSRGMGM